jgi:hypothetical protein
MHYILIFVFMPAFSANAATSQAIEFRSSQACQAAAAEVLKQAKSGKNDWSAGRVPILFCAAKG